jgi:sodium-dependent dicarboxylate transporter 2/3/5
MEGGKEQLMAEAKALGPMNRGARRTILVLAGAAAAWVLLPSGVYLLPPGIWERIAWVDEYAVGLIAGFFLFVVPSDLRRGMFLLDWGDTRFVEWGVLLLFGGGIALSDALFRTGLAEWIATSFVGLFGTSSPIVMMAAVALLAVAMTELMSNTAVVTMLAPIVISVGRATETDPVLLTIAMTLAASLAFMLPVSTPPNALVYGTGYIRLRDMLRGGIVLDLVSWPLTILIVTVVAGMVLGLGWPRP